MVDSLSRSISLSYEIVISSCLYASTERRKRKPKGSLRCNRRSRSDGGLAYDPLVLFGAFENELPIFHDVFGDIREISLDVREYFVLQLVARRPLTFSVFA
jgi:hypothetical protein